MREIKAIVLHHSASSRDHTTREMIDSWHRARGWHGGCGYHWVIEGSGKLRIGREPTRQGAGSPPNRGRLGICIVGDMTREDERWNSDQVLTLTHLLNALRVVWPGAEVVGHRDLMTPGYTECPGIDVGEAFG